MGLHLRGGGFIEKDLQLAIGETQDPLFPLART